ncbi:hypothetical protein F4703DRAFT_1917955 [Phycomyces blakesleeanus]
MSTNIILLEWLQRHCFCARDILAEFSLIYGHFCQNIPRSVPGQNPSPRQIFSCNNFVIQPVRKNRKIDKWDRKKKLAAKKLLEGQVSNPSKNVKPAKKTKVISTWTFDEDYYVLDDLPHIN